LFFADTGQPRQDFSTFHIHDFDFLLVWNVYKKASSFLLQPKGFGMRIYEQCRESSSRWRQ